eukprot:s1413_g3.t1
MATDDEDEEEDRDEDEKEEDGDEEEEVEQDEDEDQDRDEDKDEDEDDDDEDEDDADGDDEQEDGGDRASKQESFAQPKTQGSWWDASQEALLYMIGLSAQTLKAKEAFRQDLAILRLLQRSCLERLYKSDPELDAPATVTPLGIDAINGPTSDDEGAQSPQTRDSPAASPQPAGDKRSDLEDVLASFTPRLRAIREEQECEYRISFPRSSEREETKETPFDFDRPSIRPEICIDLYILRLMAGAAQRWFRLNTDLPSLVDEYGSRLVDELDFRREAERASEFRQHVHDLELNSVTAAKPVTELTTASVLVTEWVAGERLEAIAARDLEEAKRLQGVAMTTYLAMLLEMGSLHADPHWGNWLRRKACATWRSLGLGLRGTASINPEAAVWS